MKTTQKIIRALYHCTRPLLGYRGSCIYEYSCSRYLFDMVESHSLLYAMPRILLRLISCNPLTALIITIYNSRDSIISLISRLRAYLSQLF